MLKFLCVYMCMRVHMSRTHPSICYFFLFNITKDLKKIKSAIFVQYDLAVVSNI